MSRVRKAFRQEKQRDGYVLVCRCARREEKVNLYCPECWGGALDMLRQAKEEILGHGAEE
tara:strand:+ start:510 stop:689 length:180 start_codon:yes stop_codon:yes gene_type:complete